MACFFQKNSHNTVSSYFYFCCYFGGICLSSKWKRFINISNTNYDFFWVSKAIKLGLDVEGGMYAVYEADISVFESEEETESALEGTMSNLQSLLFNEGYTEATVTKQGRNQIRVEVPSIEDTEHLISLLGEPAVLEFKDSSGTVVIKGGEHLERATAMLYEGQYVISLKFNQLGTEAFAKATASKRWKDNQYPI